MKILFWSMFFCLIHTWALYPMILALACPRKKKVNPYVPFLPPVTVLLTVHNEEKVIQGRLQNLASQNYPEDLIEILVASDGSTDRTDEIVRSWTRRSPLVKLLPLSNRGKSAAQNKAIPQAQGEIVILTDAGTLFDENTITNLVRHFADNNVGCVSGRLFLGGSRSSLSKSQGLYWRFEMLLRRLESASGLLHTASGCVMAVRKSIFRQFENRFGDDCVIPLDVVLQGHTVLHDDETMAYDEFSATAGRAFRDRVRMTLRNVTGTVNRLTKLNPLRQPFAYLAILSHKIMRWLTPYFLLGLLGANLCIVNKGYVYATALLLQITFYATGLLGFWFNKRNLDVPIAGQVFSFLLANTGFFVGILKAVAGQQISKYDTHDQSECNG